ncbi:MAG TPA: DUF6351 family protein [Casimicrobiaceae bacterium]|nr:DUF6351 family protein [Casimicrobiaceae bacterium]
MKSPLQQWIAAGAAPGFSESHGASLFSTALSVGVAAFAIVCAASVSAAVLDIKTLSTRPDRVSGGDVLVQITQDNNAATPVLLNGTDVTTAFRAGSAPNTRVGLVTGLIVGTNNLSSGSVSLQIHNYPITGPITSGPHNVPFFCQTQDFTLPDGTKFGLPTDADCSAPTKITYLYMPTGGTAFQPLPSTTTLPPNVAQTTTTTGATVNFVVRVETATINRGIYQTAVLHDPTVDPAPTWFAPPRGWNKRLIAIEGFGCPGGWYIQGASIGSLSLAGLDFNLLSPARLGAGYALFSNTLQHASNSCNSVLSGEAAMMSKEHFIETFGVPVYTVSYGCSGGSYGSSQLADALPGLFDGILIACTFPDPLGIAFSGSDGHLLTHYFNVTDPAGFSVAQQVAVSGYKGLQAFIDAANQSGRTDPVPGRVDIPGYASAVWNAAVPVASRYNPTTNPGGLRPTVYDWGRNIYGVNGTTGFALRPFDNVGVQYGLAALNAGQITTTQFLNLNESIGGYDQDFNYVPNRVAGDPGAIVRAQEGGLQLGGNGGLASIPVFDVSGIYNDDGGYHYQWFHFAMRERMIQANGNADNHVMWRGNPVNADQAWTTFEQWMEAIAADTSNLSQRDKAIRNKPAMATDGCWKTATIGFWRERQTFSRTNNSICNTLYPSYAFPRYVAGGPVAANIIKCQLKPVNPGDYSVSLSAAEVLRLNRIFPNGVCDWSKPGVNQTGVVPWASFGPAPENLVFAGSVAADCGSLANLTFEGNTTISAATLVTSGTLVTPANQTLTNLPAFCRVQALSKPSSDSNIYFEVWLPQTTWNGKFLSSGEGGYAGALNYTRLGLDGGLDELLRRGYATASTDTGHVSSNTFWAIGHPEKAIDYLYRSKHLVTVAAKGLVAAYYGQAPTHSYFNSCSNGGRQGLMEIQRYPEDYDGVVVGAPWNFQSHSNAGFVWNAQALIAPGAAIAPAKLPAITAAVLAACDANDGLVDGVIANPQACSFNPATLLCQGAETNACLTQPQLTALQQIYQGPRNPRTGAEIFPGFMIGAEAGWSGLVNNVNGTGLEQGYFPNLTFENPSWDFRTFNFDSDMAFADAKVGVLGNSTQLDLSTARNRGVKVIQYHGWNDQTLQPAYSPEYYNQVASVMGGTAATQGFYRLFMVPGMTHCYFGPGATSFGGVGQQIPPVRDATHDVQTALEAWVEHGVAPGQLIATKYTDDAAATRTILLTRPLCVYPSVPRYNGTGNSNDAANFSCASQ